MGIAADGYGAEAERAGTSALLTPMPLIESERRLHVRAYHYWEARREGRLMPTLADCVDIGEAPFATRMILLDLAEAGQAPRVRGIGVALKQELPPLHAPAETGLIDELIARVPALAIRRAPVGFEAEMPDGASPEPALSFRGILLPLADARGAMAHVLGVMSWRRAIAAPLADDVLGALATVAAGAPAIAPTPPWPTAAEGAAPPPPPASPEQRLAAARTWLALARTSPAQHRAHVHAAIAGVHDAMAGMADAGIIPAVRFVFGAETPPARMATIVRAIVQARRLGITGARFVQLLDADGRGLEGFLAAPRQIARAASMVEPVGPRFRLAPLSPELLRRPRRRGDENEAPATAERGFG